MDIRYFQRFYVVELIDLDEKNRSLDCHESFYSENLEACQYFFNKYQQENIPARLRYVYAEVDIDGGILEIIEVLQEIDKTY